jgi:Pretoxin HINT domain
VRGSSLQTSFLLPIEDVPLGARIPTKNPRPWEYDDSFPEPNQATWAKLSITMYRTDGGIVDAELIRPRWWIKSVGIEAGKLLPMNIEELQVKGSALVTSVDECPEIAGGEGSVVTARFCTREVHTIARVEILGPDGQIETLEGTTIHPIWSEDRQDWVPLGELIEKETLRVADGPSVVLSLIILNQPIAVYNIEVHGEHVYQVGELGVLVHNAADDCAEALAKFPGSKLVELSRLIPPATRPFADSAKMLRHGPFDWAKFTPIIVESEKSVLHVMDGMTRIANAMKAGITHLPARIYPRT